jgi:hypothetical protein
MSATRSSLEFLNHAGFLLDHGEVTVAVDPWLFGDVFNRGWDLLSSSVFRPEDFARVSHIWLSHEHPDHFSIGAFKAVPPERRERITVLYQRTRDRRVIGFCEKLGFKTRELAHREWLELAPGFRILTGRVPLYDTWLLAEIGGTRMLNVNDCILADRRSNEDVHRITGDVDVLFTQFGYANWAGNPEQPAVQQDLAAKQLQRIALQMEVFHPRYVVPFASFIRFAHEENAYLNDHNNKIRKVSERIKQVGAAPVVLYPGDRWSFEDGWNSEPAIARYEADSVGAKPQYTSTPVSVEELISGSQAYLARIRKRNNRALIALLAAPPLRFLAPVRLELFDEPSRAFAFDLRNGLREVASEGFEPEIRLHSESLAFVFAFDFGIDTLLVNGRFRASQQDYWKMLRTFSLGSLNNGGRALSFRLAAEFDLIWWALQKLYVRQWR